LEESLAPMIEMLAGMEKQIGRLGDETNAGSGI